MTITQKITAFFQDVLAEMKKVNWLTRKEIVQYTGIVLLATFVAAAFLGGLDYLFTEILKYFILK